MRIEDIMSNVSVKQTTWEY